MRQSRYNVTTQATDGALLVYNAANGAFAVLADDARDAYEAAAGELQELPEQFGWLADAGFLTERTPEEELELQRDRFRQASGQRERLELCIAPTYACNCRCPYCYEQDKRAPATAMTPEVEARILHFVDAMFATRPFSQLRIQWYGGDPSMALDVVERLSQAFIAWCAPRGVAYDAMMLSNCARIDDDAAELLARCGVSSLLATVDGPEELHNARRPLRAGGNAYAQVMAGIDALQHQGIRVDALMNVDKVSMPLYPELAAQMGARGVALTPAKLNDYAHTFGQAPFAPPDFDLFTHEEFHRETYRVMREAGLDAPSLRHLLRPTCRFCAGQMENYFVIDAVGDVYQCDGWMGDRSRVLFSLLDDLEAAPLRAISFDPFADAQCRDCQLLPQCFGNCSWERERCGFPCHPLMTTIGDYLRDYAACFAVPTGESALLAPPFEESEIRA